MSISISALTLVAISVDRYYLVVRSNKPPIRAEGAVKISALVWIGAYVRT